MMFRLVQVKDSWQPVAASGVLALVLGYAYLLLSRVLAAPIMYLAITLSVMLPILAGLWILYGAYTEDADAIFEKHLNQQVPSQVHEFQFPSTGSRQVDLGIA